MRGIRIARRSSRSERGAARPLRELLAPYLRPYRGRVSVVSLCAFVGGFVEAFILVLIARAALAIANRDHRFRVTIGPIHRVPVTITQMLLLAGVLVIVRAGLDLLQSQLTIRMFNEIARQARRELVGLYFGSSWSAQAGATQGRLQEYVSNVVPPAAGAGQWVINGVVAGLSFAGLMITALAVNVVASILVTIVALLLALVLRPLRLASRHRARRSVTASVDLSTMVAEYSGLAQEVRIFEVESAVTEAIGGRTDVLAHRLRSQQTVANLVPNVYQTAALGMIVVALGAVSVAGFSRLSDLSAVVLIMFRSMSYGQAIQRSVQGAHEAASSLELLTEELDRLRAVQVDRAGAPLATIGSLAFDHVSFTYDGELDALHDLSFETHRGEVIGIVGPSGAGKSTLMQLILRLRDPTHGRVLVDGVDAAQVSIDDWYHHVTFVPQEVHLFDASVADNIRFFREGITDEQVVAATRLANLHDEVVARPDGYASSVGPGGRELSGGQRQRLCIARALVEHPDVLILDEPTSALDVRSEALIRDALGRISQQTTVFIIAHRLSTLAICNRIMVLQGGDLMGFDRPDRLEQTNPFYREALQLSGLK